MPDSPVVKFLVIAHRGASAVDRLADRVTTIPGASAHIIWDVAHAGRAAELSGRHEYALTNAPYGWGGWGQVLGLLDSVDALASEKFDWLVVLSGSDYPIRPLAELSSMLARTEHALFLQTPEGGTVLPPSGPMHTWTYLQRRYFCSYRWFPQSVWSHLTARVQRVVGAGAQRTLHRVTRGDRLFVQRRPRGFSPALATPCRSHPFTDQRPCRKGSDWFALSRPVVDDLIERSRAEVALRSYFERTYIPSESFFHTLLLPEWENRNAGVNLHYRRFRDGSSHPDVLHVDDIPEMRASGQYFARHFDPVDTVTRDVIDERLLDTS